jgi:hypothetical protein
VVGCGKVGLGCLRFLVGVNEMYLEWMKKKRLYFLIIQLLLISVLIIHFGYKVGFIYYFLICLIFFGTILLVIFKFIYINSTSRKLNLLLMLWDSLFLFSLGYISVNRDIAIYLLISTFSLGTGIVFYAKYFNVRGC